MDALSPEKNFESETKDLSKRARMLKTTTRPESPHMPLKGSAMPEEIQNESGKTELSLSGSYQDNRISSGSIPSATAVTDESHHDDDDDSISLCSMSSAGSAVAAPAPVKGRRTVSAPALDASSNIIWAETACSAQALCKPTRAASPVKSRDRSASVTSDAYPQTPCRSASKSMSGASSRPRRQGSSDCSCSSMSPRSGPRLRRHGSADSSSISPRPSHQRRAGRRGSIESTGSYSRRGSMGSTGSGRRGSMSSTGSGCRRGWMGSTGSGRRGSTSSTGSGRRGSMGSTGSGRRGSMGSTGSGRRMRRDSVGSTGSGSSASPCTPMGRKRRAGRRSSLGLHNRVQAAASPGVSRSCPSTPTQIPKGSSRGGSPATNRGIPKKRSNSCPNTPNTPSSTGSNSTNRRSLRDYLQANGTGEPRGCVSLSSLYSTTTADSRREPPFKPVRQLTRRDLCAILDTAVEMVPIGEEGEPTSRTNTPRTVTHSNSKSHLEATAATTSSPPTAEGAAESPTSSQLMPPKPVRQLTLRNVFSIPILDHEDDEDAEDAPSSATPVSASAAAQEDGDD